MRPQDLLACQVDLVQKFDNDTFQEILVGSLSGPYMPPDAFKRGPDGLIHHSKKTLEQWRTKVPDWIKHKSTGAMQNWARYGMAIEVTEHMVDLVNWVANEFDDTEAIDLDLAPSPYGLVHLAKSIKSHDVHGEDLWTDWLLWGPVNEPGQPRCIACVTFNDMWVTPDPQSLLALEEAKHQGAVHGSVQNIGRWAYSTFLSMYQDQRLGPQEWPVNDLVEKIREQQENWAGEDAWKLRITPTQNLSRIVYALWTVMNQPIATLEQHHPDRATKRRVERMRIPPQVTVITLRRPDNPHRHEGESGVEWQHHWIVRGHPRWQPYGPHRSERRLIWISPHFRGNLDAPLKQSEKVYVVKR